MTACASPAGKDSTPGGQASAARSIYLEQQLASGQIRDERAEFRQILCELRGPEACQKTLRSLADEAPVAALPNIPKGMRSGQEIAQHFRIGFVSGLFAECLTQEDWPFADTHRAMQQGGYSASYWPVGGRSSVEQNALRLRQFLSDQAPDARPWIVVAYSKGLPDLLHMLSVGAPPPGQSIAAIVSIAGASGGSLLADRHEKLYRNTLRWMPLGPCGAGSGEEIHDLRTDVRAAWWQQNGRKAWPPIWTLVAAPEPQRVSPVLQLSHKELSSWDPLNDGQLRLQDAMAPGSKLMALVNADHWGIGMALGRHHLWLRPLLTDEVDREGLIKSAIELIARRADHPTLASPSLPAQ